MSKLSKDKRNQLVLAIALTLAVVVGLYFLLIRGQLDRLHGIVAEKQKKATSVQTIEDTKNKREQIEAELGVVSRVLQEKEQDMASGDLYSTMITMITAFKQPYNVDIPQFTAGSQSDVNLLPKFPYKQYTLTIAGTAFYSDLGQFVAGFENRFPSSRILNLELSPAPSQSPEDKEKLQFKMDIVALVKAASQLAK